MRSRRRRKNQRVGSRLRRRKISTKLDLLGNLIATVDVLIISGAMANTFLAAQGKRPASLCERDLVGTAREILTKASSRKCEILLPVDAVVAQKFEANAPSHVVPVDAVGSDDMILDIGPRSIEHVVSLLARMKTLVWNGPFGAFELELFGRRRPGGGAQCGRRH